MFFFIKQKTAYEMRISDWSSDVCSSDLREFVRQCRILDPGAGLVAPEIVHGTICVLIRQDVGKSTNPVVEATFLPELFIKRAAQIGRASCRERVCQYV